MIEEVSQGLNRPNIIYLTAIDFENEPVTVDNSGTAEFTVPEPQNLRLNNTDINNTDISDTNLSIHQKKTDTLVSDNGLFAKQKSDRLIDGIKKVDTDPSVLKEKTVTKTSGDGYHELNKREQYRAIIAENIEYYSLKEKYAVDSEQIDEILDVLVETVSSKKEKHKVGGEELPASIVKSKLLKLNPGHIEYVLECMHRNTTKIKNIRSYMLTALYNAPSTISTYFNNQVNHNLYGTPS